MEKEDISVKCKQHGYELAIYCVQCKTKICQACITLHSKQKHEFLFIKDYVSEVLSQKIDKLSSMLGESGDKIAKQSSVFIQELPELRLDLVAFKKKLAEISREVTALIELLGEGREPYSEKEIVKEAVHKLEEAKAKLSTAKIESIPFFEKELEELEKSFLFLLNLGDAFAPVKAEFQALKKQIEANTTLANLANVATSLSMVMRES